MSILGALFGAVQGFINGASIPRMSKYRMWHHYYYNYDYNDYMSHEFPLFNYVYDPKIIHVSANTIYNYAIYK